MITHSEYLKHVNAFRNAIIKNGDLRTILSVMDKAEVASIRKSMQIIKNYWLQKRIITYAEFQTNTNVINQAIAKNGDLKKALATKDKSEAESIRRSLQIVKIYGLQKKMQEKQYK